eukprot:5340518-Prymnesium_polylepis.1
MTSSASENKHQSILTTPRGILLPLGGNHARPSTMVCPQTLFEPPETKNTTLYAQSRSAEPHKTHSTFRALQP